MVAVRKTTVDRTSEQPAFARERPASPRRYRKQRARCCFGSILNPAGRRLALALTSILDPAPGPILALPPPASRRQPSSPPRRPHRCAGPAPLPTPTPRAGSACRTRSRRDGLPCPAGHLTPTPFSAHRQPAALVLPSSMRALSSAATDPPQHQRGKRVVVTNHNWHTWVKRTGTVVAHHFNTGQTITVEVVKVLSI
ncbi:hypothetical protein BS78_K086000 [Paspalum vaginatum]|uniref:Uncharacterized protein n=1 Tax=Paspalum vaginatum TaxID=158149 RepID=A0A9W7XE93_9POAL|nr:hypothetical protein BS78_K086000 [Paspalum vaginatum]